MAKKPSFAVERTCSVEAFVPAIPHYVQDKARLWKIFDTTPVEEIRKRCIEELKYPFKEQIPLFTERIRAYLAINDYPTVFMLLRGLIPANDEWTRGSISEVVFDVFEEALTKGKGFAEPQKEIAVIFCGFLAHDPESYSKRARDLVQKVLEIRHDGSEFIARIQVRLLNLVGKLKDVSLLPVVEKLIMPMEAERTPYTLLQWFEYLSVSDAVLALDAKARQVAAFLAYLVSKEPALSSA